MVLEKTLESPLDCKEIQPVHPKGDQSWVFTGRTDYWNSNTLTTWWEELTHLKRPWCWEGLGAGGEGDDRGWDGWMASLIQWTWVWVNSRSWWWTGRPGVLRFMGSQRAGHNWTTELNWTELKGLCREYFSTKWNQRSLESQWASWLSEPSLDSLWPSSRDITLDHHKGPSCCSFVTMSYLIWKIQFLYWVSVHP